jgi:WXG100 family type VII secretion target
MSNIILTKVDPARLRSAAAGIDSSLSIVEKALASVDDALINSLQPTWQGDASARFYSAYSNNTQRFASAMKEFRSYNEHLKQASGVFDGADSNAGSLVGGLQIE